VRERGRLQQRLDTLSVEEWERIVSQQSDRSTSCPDQLLDIEESRAELQSSQPEATRRLLSARILFAMLLVSTGGLFYFEFQTGITVTEGHLLIIGALLMVSAILANIRR
jgi:hypothetical protein